MEEIKGDECFLRLDKSQYIIFYFTASWCGPCKRIYPDLLEIIKQLDPEKIIMFKIDIDDSDNNEICEKCNIKSVPSFILFKDRTYIDSVKGADKEKIINMINRNCINNNKKDN
jgi:thioredoxin 1